MDCGGRDTNGLQDAHDIDSLIISMETVKQRASSLKCSPVTLGPSEPRREMQVCVLFNLVKARILGLGDRPVPGAYFSILPEVFQEVDLGHCCDR